MLKINGRFSIATNKPVGTVILSIFQKRSPSLKCKFLYFTLSSSNTLAPLVADLLNRLYQPLPPVGELSMLISAEHNAN